MSQATRALLELRFAARAEELRARVPVHTRALGELRERALPYDETQRAADRASHPLHRCVCDLSRLIGPGMKDGVELLLVRANR